MDKNSMIHGIITNGGEMANIIPELTEAHFYLRTTENHLLTNLEQRFEQMVKAAALAANCEYDCNNRPNTYLASKRTTKLENIIAKKFNELNWDNSYIKEKISSDYANLSQDFPLCNFFFGISADNQKTPLHTAEFKQLATTTYALQQAIQAGLIMAESIFE
jgi:metal-dependent amidase/aminoacylase/carboxypeptidase family protein